MISQRFNLFYAGYTSSLPTLFFKKQKIKDGLEMFQDSELNSYLHSYFSHLEDEKPEHESHLISALNLAKSFDILDFEIPHTHQDYFKWFDEYVQEFESKFPMGRMEHYYFLYARKLAELTSQLELLKTYIDLHLLVKDAGNFRENIKNSIIDCELIIFKLMAPAALLSSEPRQSCFNKFYQQMTLEIKVLSAFHLTEMPSATDLQNLKQIADQFKNVVTNGFKKCIETLNKLSDE